MTRKALRKRLRTQAKQANRASIPRSAVPLEDRRRPGRVRGLDDSALHSGLRGRIFSASPSPQSSTSCSGHPPGRSTILRPRPGPTSPGSLAPAHRRSRRLAASTSNQDRSPTC